MKKYVSTIYALFICVGLYAQPSIGVINDFEDNTTQSWAEAGKSPNPPTAVASGGPAGADDNYINNLSSGTGAEGSRWIMFNTSSDWTGDWTSAGVAKISMDIRNSGSNDVVIRIAVDGSGGKWSTSEGITVMADNEWQRIELDVLAGDMSSSFGGGGSDVSQTLSNVTNIRVLHNASPAWKAASIAASIDVDNITTHAAPIAALVVACAVDNNVTTNGGSDGQATVSITDGAAPFTINISVGGNSSVLTGVSGDNILSDLTAGMYDISVLDGTEMSATCSFEITEPGVVTDSVFYKALMVGKNQVFPKESMGYGDIDLILVGDDLTVDGTFSGLGSAVATNLGGGAHIHIGYAGQEGVVDIPLVVTLEGDSTTGSFVAENNTFTLTAEQKEHIASKRYYINLHSKNIPSGEIRGQVLAAVDCYSANLFGSNQVPPVMTRAYGSTMLELAGNQLTVSGSFSGLEGDFAIGAHIHLAMAGMNGGVEIPLVVSQDTSAENGKRAGVFTAADNSFDLTADQVDHLKNRRFYINVHSEKINSGEIRGQVVSARARNLFRAGLSGASEQPRVMTLAHGMVIAEVMNDTTVYVSGTFTGLESPLAIDIAGGAHIHIGMAGQNREVFVPLSISTMDSVSGRFAFADNQFTVNTDDTRRLYRRGNYVNVHSEKRRAGELRGQFVPESQIVFNGYMSSIFSVPEAMSRGLGDLKATLMGNTLTLGGSFSGLSSPIATNIAGGGHIHLGMAGSTGEVLVPINMMLEADSMGAKVPSINNTFELAEDQITMLRRRGLYVNIHTQNNPAGEIRAQLLHEAQIYFCAPLSGASHTRPIRSDATGMILAELSGSKVFLSGSFNELGSPLNVGIRGGVHIHAGVAGTEGAVIQDLSSLLSDDSTSGVFPVMNNGYTLSDGKIDTLRKRGYYINIHSLDIGSGEIRGQLMPFANAYFTSTLSAMNHLSRPTSFGTGAMKAELNGNKLHVTGSFSGLSSALNTTLNGGVHIHSGGVQQDGGITFPLSAALSADSTAGAFGAMGNTFDVDSAQKVSLATRAFYFNLHTLDNAPGELRGQLVPEINRFPTAVEITEPTDESTIVIDSSDNSLLVSWTTSDDRDPIAYELQLSALPTFGLASTTGTGLNNFLETDFATLGGLLESIGVNMGDSILLFARVIATDGSLRTPGSAISLTFVNDQVTSIFEIANGTRVTLYPNPTTDVMRLDFSEPLEQRSEVLIMAPGGRILQKHVVNQHVLQSEINVTNLPSGWYVLKLGSYAVPFIKQ